MKVEKPLHPKRLHVSMLLLVLILALGTSCEQKGIRISQSEKAQLEEAQESANELLDRLASRFENRGYSFELAYQDGSGSLGSVLSKGPNLLTCNGTSDMDSASALNTELQEFLTADELGRLEIMYELKSLPGSDRKHYVSAETLELYQLKEGEIEWESEMDGFKR